MTNVLLLAPHLSIPLRNGADIYAFRLAQYSSRSVKSVRLVGQNQIVDFVSGVDVGRETFPNRARSKAMAGLRTVIGHSHYYLEKFITPAYQHVVDRVLRDCAYDVIICSYIVTSELVAHRAYNDIMPPCVILTHNDEFKWFEDLGSSHNPAFRLAARWSGRWLRKYFAIWERDMLFVHVTEADKGGYEKYFPHHTSVVVPIGVEIPEGPMSPIVAGVDTIRLLFVGALGVQMNFDALQYFSSHFEPVLRSDPSIQLVVNVAGSRPSRRLAELCRANGWTLYPNVTDERLHVLYQEATFAILPFSYATGAKLKLLEALAHGVPYLATTSVKAQANTCIIPSLMSDDPVDWLSHIQWVKEHGISSSLRSTLADIARANSWERSAESLFNSVRTWMQSAS